MSTISVNRKIGNTEYNYKILTAGVKFAVPAGSQVTVLYNGKRYPAKMHSTSAGRIDRLTEFYKDSGLQIGDEVTLTYDSWTDEITITAKAASGTYSACEPRVAASSTPEMARQPQAKEVQQQLEFVHVDMLDPVAIHWEYYRGYKAERTVANGLVIYYWDKYIHKHPMLMECTGDHKTELPINDDIEDCSCVGLNNCGLWFMKYNYRSTARNGYNPPEAIIRFDLKNLDKKVIKFNRKKSWIDHVYIYEDNIYFVAEVTENKQELIWMDGDGVEHVMFTARKGESICHVSADNFRVAFKISTDRDGEIDHWFIYNIGATDGMRLGIERNPQREWMPLVDIEYVDLKNNCMWTTMTDGEQRVYGTGYKDLIMRALEEPKEGRHYIHKTTRKPITFKAPKNGQSFIYFDGKDGYYSESYTHLARVEEDGTEYHVGRMGHGEADRIVVTPHYILVNYDALTAVRLPRRFKEAYVYAANHPDAELIFGNVDYRL